jgi:3-(3-hydroxy-phenyl)propionate hydroxylase
MAKSIHLHLGLGFEGRTYEDRFLLVSTDADLGDADLGGIFPNMETVAYIFDPEEWVIVMTLPDTVRLVFRLNPNEKADEVKQLENVKIRIANFFQTELTHDIKAVSTYHVHQRITEKFRVGRTIVEGDSAHINNPTSGMGMNSGIHDSQMLAKNLVAVLNGESETLLDEYAKIRKEVAVKMVQATTDQNYRNLSAYDDEKRQKRDNEFRDATNYTKKAREYLLKTTMLTDRV